MGREPTNLWQKPGRRHRCRLQRVVVQTAAAHTTATPNSATRHRHLKNKCASFRGGVRVSPPSKSDELLHPTCGRCRHREGERPSTHELGVWKHCVHDT